MLKTGDDLPKLFRSLGNAVADSRSANSTASQDAEQRWPLLKAMPPKEPPRAPLLTALEKLNWQGQDTNEHTRPSPAPTAPSLGDKLALSLKKISAHAKTEQSPKKTRTKPAVAAAAPEQQPISAPAPNTAPLAILSSSPQDAGQPSRPKKKIIATENKGEPGFGMMWGKKELAAELPATDNPRGDDSLKSVFGRLEPIKNEIKPVVMEKRPSYLGRLGRK